MALDEVTYRPLSYSFLFYCHGIHELLPSKSNTYSDDQSVFLCLIVSSLSFTSAKGKNWCCTVTQLTWNNFKSVLLFLPKGPRNSSDHPCWKPSDCPAWKHSDYVSWNSLLPVCKSYPSSLAGHIMWIISLDESLNGWLSTKWTQGLTGNWEKILLFKFFCGGRNYGTSPNHLLTPLPQDLPGNSSLFLDRQTCFHTSGLLYPLWLCVWVF